MVDILCTRCGATGTGYETNFVAKFSLKHETGCGAKIGIPKFSTGTKTIETQSETVPTKITKQKKKKSKKKKSID